MSYRRAVCVHCGDGPGADACTHCGLSICIACRPFPCKRGGASWTGRCATCGAELSSEQRHAVLERGESETSCARCGTTRRLVRLERVRDTTASMQLRSATPSACDACRETLALDVIANLLVSEDRWESTTHTQSLYHLLCMCGAVLASSAGPRAPRSR